MTAPNLPTLLVDGDDTHLVWSDEDLNSVPEDMRNWYHGVPSGCDSDRVQLFMNRALLLAQNGPDWEYFDENRDWTFQISLNLKSAVDCFTEGVDLNALPKTRMYLMGSLIRYRCLAPLMNQFNIWSGSGLDQFEMYLQPGTDMYDTELRFCLRNLMKHHEGRYDYTC